MDSAKESTSAYLPASRKDNLTLTVPLWQSYRPGELARKRAETLRRICVRVECLTLADNMCFSRARGPLKSASPTKNLGDIIYLVVS